MAPYTRKTHSTGPLSAHTAGHRYAPHWFLCAVAGVDGRFWYVNSSGLVCADGEAPEDFTLELLERGRLAIRGKNGKYLRGDQGGTLKGDGLSLSSSALWEF